MNFFELFQFIGTNVWLYGIVFLIVLSILVFVHEWGHYIVARWCGVSVETFSIGFGKEIAGFHDKNGTRWKFALFPLGGYVKLFGDVDPASARHDDAIEDDETGQTRPLTEEEKTRAFFAKPVWQRALIVLAGPAINYLFAIIILALLFIFNGQPITPPSAAAVIGGSSAEANGFQPHDVVLSIDGKEVASFEDIKREMMIALDDKKHFVVERDGKIIDIYAQPKKITQEDRFGFVHSRGLLGLISPRHAVDIQNIQAIDGVVFENAEDVRARLNELMGTEFTIEVKRGAESDKLIVNPLAEYNASINNPDDPQYRYLLLSDTQSNVFLKYGPVVAFKRALWESWVITRGTMEALGQMVVGTRSAAELGGVIRMGALAGDMARQGIVALVLFTALLSINLGLINLFPIPMLDGGHLLFYAIEALLGRPIPEQIQEYAFRLGLAFLVGIMVFANLNDIMHLLL